MVAVLQVCSDSINLELNETNDYNFTDNQIFETIKEARQNDNILLGGIIAKFSSHRSHHLLMKRW